MHMRGVLIEPCRQHVFAVFQRHAVMMIDELARFVIVKIFVVTRLASRARLCFSVAAQIADKRIGKLRHDQVGAGAEGSRLLTITNAYSTIISVLVGHGCGP